MRRDSPAEPPVASFARAFRIAAAIVVLILAGIAVLAWMTSGSDATLPFQYGGFD